MSEICRKLLMKLSSKTRMS